MQVSDDGDRAGSSSVTLVVTSLEDQLTALKAEGIPVGSIQGTPGLVKVATVTDPEGNRITFAEDLADKTRKRTRQPSSSTLMHQSAQKRCSPEFVGCTSVCLRQRPLVPISRL